MALFSCISSVGAISNIFVILFEANKEQGFVWFQGLAEQLTDVHLWMISKHNLLLYTAMT